LGLKVLSLFDGMSCGQLALQRLGIEVDTYYASEIDKYAIQVTQANFPETIQVGDVCELKAEDYQDIDLILAGSPCQGFSFAGKQLAFDDPRSALFFEFIRLLKEIKPKYFLLENVKMKQQFQDVITEQVSACYPDFEGGDLLGGQIKPILINSALLSAQNRQRLYWTNIPNIEQPEDKGIVLRDILEDEINSEFYYKEKSISYMERGNDKWQQAGKRRKYGYEQNADKEKSFTITENWHKGVPYNYFKETKPKQVGLAKEYISKKSIEKYVENKNAEFNDPYNKKTIKGNKSTALRTNSSNGNMWVNEKAIKNLPKGSSGKSWFFEQQTYLPNSEKTRALKSGSGSGNIPKVVSGAWRGRYKEDGKTEQKLELNQSGKSNSLTTVQKDSVVVNEELSWRKLTPLECMRLQTVPDDYLMPVSNTQKYKLLGNGMTVDVIAHILNNMKL
jgi:DNA (cytosine-5)-methyltransferase 3A